MLKTALIFILSPILMLGQGYVTFDVNGNVSIKGNLKVVGKALVTVSVTTLSSVTVSSSGFYINNSSGAVNYLLPAITTSTVGTQVCVRNATTRTGVITVTAPASTFIDKDGANGTAAGTIVSGGALADSACFVGITTTQYLYYPGAGTWTNH